MSLGFSNFRQWMDLWDDHVLEEEIDSKINAIVDGKGNVLYFTKGGDVFGSGEDSRVVFAKLKNPDDDLPDGWTDEATFTATNLSKSLSGRATDHVFGKSDLKAIKIIDKEDAVKKLKEQPDKDGEGESGLDISKLLNRPKDSDEAPNFIVVRDD